jgi:hypothetical protein
MRTAAILALIVCAGTQSAAAQAWNIDARNVGLGGIGGDQNVFATTVAEARGDRSIVIPLGLIQVLRERSVFKSSSLDFDPARAIELAANPLHLQFGRDRTSAGASFVRDVRNASLSPNLSVYRGFVPASMTATGLVAPKYGRTFWLQPSTRPARHGFYVGSGPHLSIATDLRTDADLLGVLSAASGRVAANQEFSLQSDTAAQLAAAVTGGYRARFSPSHGAANGGLGFVSVNVNYLHGIRYEDVDLALRLETDRHGLVAPDGVAAPLRFVRQTSSSGRGTSFDVGAGFTAGRWELGVSGNNLLNRITWSNRTEREYSMPTLFSGTPRLDRTAPQVLSPLRTRSAGDYRANLAFRGRTLSFHGEFATELVDQSFRGGMEWTRDRIEVRGAAVLVRNDWHPTVGVSVAVMPRLWLDLAGFMTTANVERERRYSVATSVRWRAGAP